MHAAQNNCRSSVTPWARWPLVLRRAALGLLGAVLAGWVVAAETPKPSVEPLGTLFYSAAERATMVRARQGQSESESAAPTSNLVTVNGVVKRKSGNSTVWVNGQAVPEGQGMAPVARLTPTDQGAKLNGKPVRVGETLDITTHERSDIVAPGAVTTIKGPE